MLSIIIPVYNESATINQSLSTLIESLSGKYVTEVLVSDGGSSDATMKMAQKFSEVTVISSAKGRGVQMNTAVKIARGDVLYFLHADSLPPKNFDKYIMDSLGNGNKAGCFRMKFDYKHWWLFLAGWFTQFNLKFFRGGDQSLFIRRELFKELKGYPEDYPIFEDFEIIRKLYSKGEFTVIQKPIITSARRYRENGVAKLQFHYWMLYLKKWGGASKQELTSYYKKNIK